jgi:GAF domain-containing protein
MTRFILTLVVLSFVLLAAHFSRHDVPVLTILCLLVPFLLLLKRPWVPRLLQLLLAIGALEWIRTAAVLGRQRVNAGEPWLRMALILAAVAVVTAGSAILLQTSSVQQRYGPEPPAT